MIGKLLRQVPYFAHLSDEHLAVLAQHAIRRRFRHNEIIYAEGEPTAGLWILETGNVKAYKLGVNGDEYVLRFFAAEDTFNDIAALDGEANPASAAAVGDVTAWVIPRAVFLQVLEADCTMGRAIIQGLAERVRQLVFQVEDLALHSVTGRLARFLLAQVTEPAHIAPVITRTLIAAHLATTPETVSRALRSLEEIGAIQFDRHRIEIVKTDLLREISLR